MKDSELFRQLESDARVLENISKRYGTTWVSKWAQKWHQYEQVGYSDKDSCYDNALHWARDLSEHINDFMFDRLYRDTQQKFEDTHWKGVCWLTPGACGAYHP
jgi:hypothetical protein